MSNPNTELKAEVCHKYTIVVRGDDSGEAEHAFKAAVKSIQEGMTSGHNRNETSAYYFTTEGVNKEDRPA